MLRAAATLLAIVPLLGLSACKEEKDLGRICKMTKPSANPGEPPEEITEDRISNPDIDYVSLGTAECEDLVCIRTAKSDNPANEEGKARGYCTAPCIESTDCEPDFQGSLGTLRCERLLLDQKYLDELKASDPATYEKTFGSGVSSKYCVKPRAE